MTLESHRANFSSLQYETRCRQLLAPELMEKVMERQPGGMEEKHFEGNLWTAPDCNYREILKKIKLLVNGTGGEIDQSLFYIDTRGAEQFLRAVSQQGYVTTQRDLPSEGPAKAIHQCWIESDFRKDRLSIVGLGCGDGMHEIQLVHSLTALMPDVHIDLYLLDISAYLLNTAYHMASQAFAGNRKISIYQIQGDFEHLDRYRQMTRLLRQSSQMVLFTMYGYTVGNMTNEQLFIRNAFRSSQKGMLLLSDVLTCDWDPMDEKTVKERDIRLSGKAAWREDTFELFRGLIVQYRDAVKNIEFSQELDYTTCIPGSYGVVIRALVDGEAEFTIFRIKRYGPKAYADMLLKEKWGSVRGFPYGPKYNPRMLYLAKRL